VRALDATYCFDLLRGDAGARDRAVEWENQKELLAIPAPAFTEFLRSGYRRGGRLLERSLTLTRRLEVLPLEGDSAEDAARLGGALDQRGLSVANIDLLIAAIARKHHAILVTRDEDFQRVPGLHLETY
jgi:tRNA(fMet)-specific endonuclease VapC